MSSGCFHPKTLWIRRRNHVSRSNFGFAFDRQLLSYLPSPPDQGDKKSEPPINLLTRPLRPLLITRRVLLVSRRLSKTFFFFSPGCTRNFNHPTDLEPVVKNFLLFFLPLESFDSQRTWTRQYLSQEFPQEIFQFFHNFFSMPKHESSCLPNMKWYGAELRPATPPAARRSCASIHPSSSHPSKPR